MPQDTAAAATYTQTDTLGIKSQEDRFFNYTDALVTAAVKI
jgi:hypothetical protein